MEDWEKETPRRQNGMCKGPGARHRLVCSMSVIHMSLFSQRPPPAPPFRGEGASPSH